jgi:hypothetical protein
MSPSKHNNQYLNYSCKLTHHSVSLILFILCLHRESVQQPRIDDYWALRNLNQL